MRPLLTLIFALTFSSDTATATSIHLNQGGWSSGGTLDVSFTGEDIDADGAIVQSELGAFHAAWETPLGDSTTWGLLDIEPEGFLFADPGNFLFFVRNPGYSLVSSAFEGEALASVFDEFLFPVDSTSTPPSAVPEPAGLSTVGLLALSARALARRRRRES